MWCLAPNGLTMEPYIETRSGIKFHFLDPKPDEINIADIGFALSNQSRFNGHCNRFYSVAEHSVLVASLVPDEYKLAALLHDAAEAYLSDIPSPIKQFIPDYHTLEYKAQAVINDTFGIPWGSDPEKVVKKADRQQLRTEAYHLITSKGEDWEMWDNDKPDPEAGRKPMCLSPKDAFGLFMAVFENLTKVEDKPKIIGAC